MRNHYAVTRSPAGAQSLRCHTIGGADGRSIHHHFRPSFRTFAEKSSSASRFRGDLLSGSSKAVLATRASRASARPTRNAIEGLAWAGERIRVVADVVSRKCTTPQRHTEKK